MKIEDFKAMDAYQQEVILILDDIRKEMRELRRVIETDSRELTQP